MLGTGSGERIPSKRRKSSWKKLQGNKLFLWGKFWGLQGLLISSNNKGRGGGKE